MQLEAKTKRENLHFRVSSLVGSAVVVCHFHSPRIRTCEFSQLLLMNAAVRRSGSVAFAVAMEKFQFSPARHVAIGRKVDWSRVGVVKRETRKRGV